MQVGRDDVESLVRQLSTVQPSMSNDQEIIRPWERQPDESEEAYEAFEAYRNMGVNRGIRPVGEQLDKSRQLIGRWSSRHRWVERSGAYDRFIARTENERIVLGRAEMRNRHITNAKNLQVQISKRVYNMTDREIAQLKPRELAALLRTVTEIERKAREVSVVELESGKSDFAPTFIIEFVPSKPPDMLQVRLKDGTAGFIPPAMRDKFFEDYPDAVIVQHEGDNSPTPTERGEMVL